MFPPSHENRFVTVVRHRSSPPPSSWSRLVVRGWRPVVILAVAVLLVCLVSNRDRVRVHLPDFSAIEDTNARKAAFFDYLAPLAKQVNKELASPRNRLEAIDNTLAAGWPIGPLQREFVISVATRHKIEPIEEIDRVLLARLLSRVDTVPPSLILAQAALESGWGDSRFAREGNNLFGMRCYTPGCGIIPSQRAAGSKFEVTVYPDPTAAIRAYVLNINTNPRYRSLRRLRAQYRSNNESASGAALATGLVRYSELGAEYIERVQSVIRDNDLHRFDTE